MKSFWILVAIAGSLSQVSPAQTGGVSASGNASVSGQVDGNAKASQATQTGASANANASAQSQVNTGRKEKTESKPSTGANRPGGAGTSAFLASGTTLNAELTHSLDAKSAKPGDEVTAKVTEDVKSNGKVVVHKGSKLVGHVTEARARTKDNADSQLGIVFDKAVLKSGEELSFNGAMQAMAPPVNAALAASGEESSMINAPSPGGGGGARRSGGGGLVGGVTSTATGVTGGATGAVTGATTGTVNGTGGLVGGLTAQGRLTNASQGAIGLQGLTLTSATAGSAQGSVVSSTTRNVKLESGTQMLLKVAGAAQ